MDAFAAVVKGDPSCGIALWATGVAQWGNPFSAGAETAAQLQSGARRLSGPRRPARKPSASATSSRALAPLYDRFESVDQRDARCVAYRDAMAQLSAKYRDDPEAATFYALSLAAAADPADKTYADQLKAGAILEKLWASAARSSGLPALHHPQLRRAGARAARGRGGAPLREDRARPRRTRSTCRRIRSRASATGRTPSTPTSCRRKPRARSTRSAKSCTRSTTRPTPTCRAARTPPRSRLVVDRCHAPVRRRPATALAAPHRQGRRLCVRRDSGALRARARRLGRGRRTRHSAPSRTPYADA